MSKLRKTTKVETMDINLSFMIVVSCILVPSLKISAENYSINVSQPMKDGKTLVSKGGKFELGFFSPGSSHKRYLGIWYKNIPIPTVVWVANRANPINDSSGILTMNRTGNLVLTQNGSVVWYTNSQKQAQNPVVELLESGNLVIRNEEETNPEAYLWQSFDYPSDTVLAGMKFGWDLRTGLDRRFTAWKSPDDPSPGEVSMVVKLYNYPDLYIMKGTLKLSRYGPWNGLYFSGIPDQKNTTVYGFNFVTNKDEVYFTFNVLNNLVTLRVVTNETGTTYHYSWVEDGHTWTTYRSFPNDFCDRYGLCGPYGNCVTTESQVCQCLNGFKPKSPEAWVVSDWSQGCVRNTPFICKDKFTTDGFVKFVGLKVPDTTHTWVDDTIGLEECRVKCLNNCSCMAYTISDIRAKGSGCVMWFGDLIDIKQFQNLGQDLYIRMPASELEPISRHKNTRTIIAATVASICGVLSLSCYFICRRRRNNAATNSRGNKTAKEDVDLTTFDFASISNATNHFSESNKLGQGGFGPVYRGILPEGREIAVKRLSETSRQGLDEFKNEVMLIAKLQHRNLVTLLGCSIQHEEKLLIYEFMPNRSLDYFIFDSTKRSILGWSQRFEIIGGIARGLLYLHQDSKLKIIHRDLKTGNILLDSDMNPKISDFGMARTFGLDQDEANTNRIMGTYGYMSPEYAVHGSFSVKSDVYSFGVIVLEIISGRKIKGFYDPLHRLNLLGHAWRLWIQKRPMEFMDQSVDNLANPFELLRHIHVGLLCVQQRPADRPNMSSVVLMLNGEKLLPEPSQPGFYTGNDHPSMIDPSTRNFEAFSHNEISNSVFEAR